MYSHCVNGGWILGNKIDGTQAEYVAFRSPIPVSITFPQARTKMRSSC